MRSQTIRYCFALVVYALVIPFLPRAAVAQEKAASGVSQIVKSVVAVNDSDKICGRIKNLLLTGEFRKFAVEYDEPESGRLEYLVKIDGRDGVEQLQALCGNGSDAICEMTLTTTQYGEFQFTLPATIRVITLERQTYIINGITVSSANKVQAKQYAVHKLLPNSLPLICGKF